MLSIAKDNIIVRQYNEDDFASFYKRLCKNKGWTETFQLWDLDEDDAMSFFSAHLDQYTDIDLMRKGLILGVFTKNGLLIGSCGFEFNPEVNSVEVFIGLEEKARGKRYGREIVEAIAQVCDEIGATNIHANIPEAHIIAIKVFENSRFEYVNTIDYDIENYTVKMRHYRLVEKK